MTLKNRCIKFLETRERGMLPDPDDLAAFIITEINRETSKTIKECVQMVLSQHCEKSSPWNNARLEIAKMLQAFGKSKKEVVCPRCCGSKHNIGCTDVCGYCGGVGFVESGQSSG
jgi:hypothetical protein